MLRDREAGADCVQDTFATVATHLVQLREPDKLRPWLYAIARNEAHRRLRTGRREQPSDDLPDASSPKPGPDIHAEHAELTALIADAARGLSERDRDVLDLHYRHGLSGPELADTLGISATNANTIVSRARTTIERSIGALLLARRARDNASSCSRARQPARGLGRELQCALAQAHRSPRRALREKPATSSRR